MKVTPRRYAYCYECRGETVQWLTEVTVPRGRGCFSPRSPIEEYTCVECGVEQV